MEYKGEGVAALVSVLDDMQNTNLIMIDKKVKALLKCLAYYGEFRAVLSYANRGFDFAAEKRKALIKVGERNVVRLPKNDVALVAFVSALLIESDEGGFDLISFSTDYFPAHTKQESFEYFFAGVLEPFKLALVRLVVNGIEEEQPLLERTVELAPNGLAEQMQSLLVNLVKGVNEAQIDENVRTDFLVQLEGFAAALDSRDALITRAVWIGLKKCLTASKLCLRELEKTEELLKLYLVVK